MLAYSCYIASQYLNLALYSSQSSFSLWRKEVEAVKYGRSLEIKFENLIDL